MESEFNNHSNGKMASINDDGRSSAYSRASRTPVQLSLVPLDCATAFASLFEQLARSVGAHHASDGPHARGAIEILRALTSDGLALVRADPTVSPAPNEVADSIQTIARTLESVARQVEDLTGGREAYALRHSELVKNLEALNDALVSILDAVRQRSIVDDEVRRFRNEEHKTEFLPIFRGLIAILDRWARERGRFAEIREQVARGDKAFIAEAMNWLDNARKLDKTDLRNLLAQFGVDHYRSKPGDRFNPARHHPVGLERASTSKFCGRIAEHCLPGYIRSSDQCVIVPERVRVFTTETSA